MSRVPRSREHLKTGFMTEAASAARFRAYAHRAESQGLTNLASRWRELAAAKDELARVQLEAAGQVPGPEQSLADALAEEQYENEVLYAKMMRDADAETAAVFEEVVTAQTEHARRLEELTGALQESAGRDLP